MSLILKEAEHWRIDAFKLWCWRRLLSVCWIAVRSTSQPKGNQPWIFIGRTDAEAEGPTFWPPDVKNWLLGKDPNTGKDWRQKEQGMTEDEVVRWHHRLDEEELEWAPAVDDGQGGLACCSPWGCKSQTWLSDWTDWPWSYTQSYYYFHCSKRMSLTWLSYLQGSLDFRRHESCESQR